MPGQKAITLGPFHLGMWIYDCPNLRSKVELAEHTPEFNLEIEVGGTLTKIVGIGLSAIPNIGNAAGKMDSAVPGFQGKLKIWIDVESYKWICDQKTKKQTVGYFFVLYVKFEGAATGPAGSIKVNFTLTFHIEGEKEECECNESITADVLFALAPVKTRMQTLVPLSEVPGISSGVAIYELALHPPTVGAISEVEDLREVKKLRKKAETTSEG